MKNFELVTSAAADLQSALVNLKSGIVKQLGTKNFTIQQIFISQQVIVTPTIQNPNGQQILIHNVIALLIDQDNEVADPAATNGKVIQPEAFNKLEG